MQQSIIYFAIIISFYVIGAYATTDILRLLKGKTLPVFSSSCFCPYCNKKISLKNQIPIFSYIKCKGKCKTCGIQIPKADLVLEIFLFVSLTLVTGMFHFQYISYVICIIIYEGLKVICLIVFGVRQNDFMKNLILSFLNNILIWGLVFILFVLANI